MSAILQEDPERAQELRGHGEPVAMCANCYCSSCWDALESTVACGVGHTPDARRLPAGVSRWFPTTRGSTNATGSATATRRVSALFVPLRWLSGLPLLVGIHAAW